MEKPRARSRGKETVITDEEHQKVMGQASPALGELLTALHETGARPGELCKVTAAELKCVQGVWILDLVAWKTERHGGARVIVLSQMMAELVRVLAAKYPSGPLFRTPSGKPWTEYNLDGTFRRIKSIAVLSQLLGSSVRTLQEHYAHLTTDTAALYRQLLDFKAASVSSESSPSRGGPGRAGPLAEAS